MPLIKLDLNELVDRPPLDPAILDGAGPRITGRTFLTSGDPAVSVVAWGATPYAIHPKTRPDYEFSILQSGRFDLIQPEIGTESFAAGDMFVLPPTCLYRWVQTEPTMKFALSYRPADEVTQPQHFTPLRAYSLPNSATNSDVLFRSHDGRMVVQQLRLAPGKEIAHHRASVAIGSLVSGTLTANQTVLQSGDCFALDAADDATLTAQTAAIIVLCTVS